MLKIIAFAACAFVVAVSIATVDRRDTTSFSGRESKTSAEPPARIFATGIVEGASEAVELRMETAGRIAEVCVVEGDDVRQGDVLVKLDGRRERQLVAASRARLNLAEATLRRLIKGARESERAEARALLGAKSARLRQATLSKQRIEALRLQKAVAQQEADDKSSEVEAMTAEVAAARARLEQLMAPAHQDEVEAARARVQEAEAALELAEIALDKMELRAPIDGQILDVSVKPGEIAQAGAGAPAVVLADPSKLRVRAFIEEIDAPRIERGAKASVVADGLPQRQFAAQVASLGPQMKPKTLSSGLSTELFDTKVREVVLDLDESQHSSGLIIGLRVDVLVDADAGSSSRAR
jgi:multidrug resistance efflux pump